MNSTELHRQLLNLVRKGTILVVDHEKALCRVATGELQSNWLPWLTPAAGASVAWEPPSEGEQVLLLCPGGDPADGIALRGIYSDAFPAPSDKPSTHTRRYADGAVVEYDDNSHALVATLPEGATVELIAPGAVTIKTSTATVEADTATIKAGTVTLDAGKTHCTGDLDVDGTVNAQGDVKSQGDVKAGAISLTNHDHMEQGDGKPVSKPR